MFEGTFAGFHGGRHGLAVTNGTAALEVAMAALELQPRRSRSQRNLHRLKFTLDGKHVLISDLGNGDLIVVDTVFRKEVKRISLGRGAAGILIAPDGSVAYIAVSADSNVAVVDLQTFSVRGRITTGKGPDGLAWAVRK